MSQRKLMKPTSTDTRQRTDSDQAWRARMKTDSKHRSVIMIVALSNTAQPARPPPQQLQAPRRTQHRSPRRQRSEMRHSADVKNRAAGTTARRSDLVAVAMLYKVNTRYTLLSRCRLLCQQQQSPLLEPCQIRLCYLGRAEFSNAMRVSMMETMVISVAHS